LKRSLYLPTCAADLAEQTASSTADGAHRLAFADALFQFRQGSYRFDMTMVLRLSALYLYGIRGPWSARDSLLRFRPLAADLLPAYAATELASDHPRAHGVSKVEGALSNDDAAERILEEYKSLGKHRSSFEAQREFLALCREHPCYGYEFFYGRRTWNEAETDASGAVRTIACTEDVVLCVGHDGLMYMNTAEPLEISIHDFHEVLNWSLSRDSRIFVFSLEDGTNVFIVTDLAYLVEERTELYVSEKVAAVSAPADGSGRADSSSKPRAAKDFGTPPAFVRIAAAPLPPFARAPWPFPVGGSPLEEFDASVLPEGWMELTDADGDVFYFHEATKRSSWEHPGMPVPPLPPCWVEAVDSETGGVYFWNEDSGETSWERPGPDAADVEPPEAHLEVGWSVLRDGEGDAYFFHAGTGRTTWTKPRRSDAPSLLDVWRGAK
jgi:hypothetical protein